MLGLLRLGASDRLGFDLYTLKNSVSVETGRALQDSEGRNDF